MNSNNKKTQTTTAKQSNHFFLDVFTKKICLELSQKITNLFQIKITPYDLATTFGPPPATEKGHWALPCFFLAQQLKKKPAEVALQIAKAYDNSNSPVFEKALNKGPYVNFFFKKDFLKNHLLTSILTNDFFHTPAKKIGSYLIEYSQPNTHKELHIGHTRNLCFGLSLVTLLKKRGFPVITCTYPGDMGTHVAKCLWYLKYYNKGVPTHQKGQWLGAIYTKAFQKYKKEEENPSKKEKNKQQLAEILQQLQKQQGEFYDLWKQTRRWSKDLMDEVYEWAGAKFDYWYWESEIDKPSVQWVKELLQQKKLKLSEGAIGLDLNELLGFCLLLKSDGNGLYATKDLYLARKKFADHNISENIYIVDQRQSTHFQQIFETLKQIGLTKEGEKSQHLKYNFVQLKTGAMSSRAGNIVPIMKLIREMTKYISTAFLQKYKDKWPEEKIKNTANIIAQGAIKYGMNEQELNKKIIFDMKEWLKLDGRSGPYIQYAHARACSLLKKLDAFENNKNTLTKNININYLNSPEEWQLILQMSWFSLILEKASWQMKTSIVCHYLFELAQKFSRFYQNCPIGTLDNEEQKQFRLFLVQAVRKTLKEGLSALSIPAPEQM